MKILFGEKNLRIFEHVMTALLGGVLVLLLWIYADANVNHYTLMMDSDVAADTLLGPVIYENGFVQPDTWVGSTEKCVISAPNLAAFLYPMTGHNMNLSMGLACTIMMVILAVLMVLYFKQIGFSPVQTLTAIILAFSLMRTSDEIQSMIFIYAAYYVSHFITLFLLLILYNRAIKKGKVSVIVFVLTLGLSFLNGLQGMHGCIFCYLPLLGVEIVRRIVAFCKMRKKGGTGSPFIVVWLVATFFLSFFATNFTGSYNLGASRNIRHAGEKFVEYVWPFFLEVISFDTLPVLVAIFCVLAAIGYVLTAKELLVGPAGDKAGGAEVSADAKAGAGAKVGGVANVAGGSAVADGAGAAAEPAKRGAADEAEGPAKRGAADVLTSGYWSTFVFIAGVAVCILSSTFTTAESAPRYYIMILFVVGTGTALFMKRVAEACKDGGEKAGAVGEKAGAGEGCVLGKACAAVIAVLVLVFGIGKSALFFKDLIKDDNIAEQSSSKVAAWMQERGYEYGYSTFDHANTITVVSNDKVKIRAVNSMKECLGAKWLTDKTWYPPVKSAEGPTCYIVTEAIEEDFKEFLAGSGATVVEEADADGYKIYVLDHDYTVWVDD